MRSRRTPAEYVGVSDLLGWEPDFQPEPRRRITLNLTKALVTSTVMGVIAAGIALPAVGSVGIAAREASDYYLALPTDLPDVVLPQRSTILAADGTRIATLFSENRVLVTLPQVPAVMKDALLSIEDSRFYEHDGVDFRGTARALKNNTSGGSTQGGSTLTQQYVKNVLLQSAKTPEERDEVAGGSYLRKLKEARIAMNLERTKTKDQILEGYLNIAYFGDGAYGVGTAAQHFFGVPTSKLTLDQAALIAGLVKNPNKLNPVSNPKNAVLRRNIVLDRMLEVGKITAKQHDAAKKKPLRLKVTTPANGCVTSPYPFYCQWVKESLENDPAFGATQELRDARLFRGGMIIKTALDPNAQRVAQRAVDRAISRNSRVATASVTVTPGTGHVVAMAVNRDFGRGEGKTEILLPTIPAYQPGSTFKPITLAAALEQGFPLSTVMTAPVRYTPANQNAPKGGFRNAGDSAAGTYNAAQATWRSVNTWYIKLQERTGVLNVANMAERLGITSLPRTGPRAITARDASLTLGSYEVSPVEMAGVYATFAAHGKQCRPVSIVSTTTLTGKPGPAPDPNCHQAVAPGVADTVASVLQGGIDGPDPARTGKGLGIGRPTAGKSGTTNGSSAVWYAGFTPQYATAVWVGDPRGGQRYPLRGIYANGRSYATAFGGTVAGPIWKNVMAGLSAPLPVARFRPADPNVVNGYGNITPDVRGLGRDQAILVLQQAGFTVSINKTTAKADAYTNPDRVADTLPAPGTTTIYGSTVTLILTAGSNTKVRIPDLTKQPAPAATEPQTQPVDATDGTG